MASKSPDLSGNACYVIPFTRVAKKRLTILRPNTCKMRLPTFVPIVQAHLEPKIPIMSMSVLVTKKNTNWQKSLAAAPQANETKY